MSLLQYTNSEDNVKYLIAVLMLAVSLPAFSETSEHNYKAKQNDWEYTYRHREGAWHFEVGNKVGPVEVMYLSLIHI